MEEIMSLKVKELTIEDFNEAREWLNQDNNNEEVLNLVKDAKHQYAYIAWEKNMIAGILVSWQNQFHPYCTYMKIINKRNTDHEAIGRSLLNKLIQDEVTFPIQTSLWHSFTKHITNYEKHGFKEVRRTYMPVLDVEKISGNSVIELDNTTILPLTEVQGNDTLRHELISLVKNNYERAHFINPVANLDFKSWEKLVFAEDLIQNGSYLAIDKGTQKLLAYTFLHHSTELDKVELGWCGSRDLEGIKELESLVLCQLIFAKEAGFRFVEGEFDTTDPFAIEIMRSFPFKASEAWITYHLKEAPTT